MTTISYWMPLAFQGGGLRDWGGLLLPLMILAIFYVLVFVPARRRQRDFQRMVEALKKGDRVVTTGGLYGEVVSVDNDNKTVILKIADTVKVKVARTAIASVEDEGDKGDNR